ncbi:GTPase HflX [Oscillatoria sp. FACHB-1407]|uniref:GTPase HflX n=1 Tax=Oscillatoria sp. FACHB-1407 TaxID=2692847 RepID=UPI0016886208|nr:GTPase HflX [Oscillatoria sp. FACHB-1407]MBD2459559.1 GTPase HflX [Oscillatoria sp. FACHB-1407]
MATVYGSLQGIKSSQIKQLEELYDTELSGDSPTETLSERFITPEFTNHLATLSQTIHQPICCYVNRRGQVVRVSVGTPMQTQLAEADLPRRSGGAGSKRFSGIRCLVAQFQPPDTSAFIAMMRQRLDALVVLKVASKAHGHKNGDHSVQEVYLAHIVPDIEQPWVVEPISLEALYEEDFGDRIHDWEQDIQAAGFDIAASQTVPSDRDRVLLVGVQVDGMTDQQFQDSISELVRLVESAKGEVVGLVQQKRSRPDPQTVVGHGKVEETTLEAQRSGANLIVFNQDISATQARNLEEHIGLRVVDRTGVILDIFAQRARSQAGKLQVELAQLEYMLPRLRGRGQEMSRLGAGIGTRGPGETKLETERRTIQRRIAQLQHEVDQLQAHRARLRHQRDRQDLPAIALVGYTNAGKSTLLNVLTQSDIYTADQLFATLDPTTRKLTITNPEMGDRYDLLLTDTVGFIHHLPPALMDAFRATLEEVTEADALLHVVDLSHPAWERHIQSVEEVLSDLPAMPPDALLVFNKIDQTDSETLAQAQQTYPNAVFISAVERLGLETLRQRLVQLAGAAPITSSRPMG